MDDHEIFQSRMDNISIIGQKANLFKLLAHFFFQCIINQDPVAVTSPPGRQRSEKQPQGMLHD